MPTGGGKVCVIRCQHRTRRSDGRIPLIALMKDQVDALNARIDTTFINSSLTKEAAASPLSCN